MVEDLNINITGFNFQLILDLLSKDSDIIIRKLHDATGVVVTKRNVSSWKRRNSIPGQYLLCIFLAIQGNESHKSFDFREFLL